MGGGGVGLRVVLGLGEGPLLLGRNWHQPPPRGGKGRGPGTFANPQGYIVIPEKTGRKEFRVSPGKLLNVHLDRVNSDRLCRTAGRSWGRALRGTHGSGSGLHITGC